MAKIAGRTSSRTGSGARRATKFPTPPTRGPICPLLARIQVRGSGKVNQRGSRMHKTVAALLATAVALTAPLALSAQTVDLPRRKAGLWEIKTTIEQRKAMPAMMVQACLDAATDKEMMEHGLK